jgi:hypothetical protein
MYVLKHVALLVETDEKTNTVTYSVTRHGVKTGNWIYWTLKNS